MFDSVVGPEVCGDIDDLETELCCSSREASFSFIPFANLDCWDLGT